MAIVAERPIFGEARAFGSLLTYRIFDADGRVVVLGEAKRDNAMLAKLRTPSVGRRGTGERMLGPARRKPGKPASRPVRLRPFGGMRHFVYALPTGAARDLIAYDSDRWPLQAPPPN